jgi:hypothetical protein
MYKITYALASIVNVLFTYLIAVPFAPLIAVFCKDDGYLPRWLCWFQTFDAPLDAGWKDGYFMHSGESQDSAPLGFELWWLRVRWLWRNPAYGFCYWPLGIPYNPSDWYIYNIKVNGTVLEEFAARTYDGKYFCYTNSNGVKLGYKLWWALDSDWKLIPALPASRGPDNRLPMCFSPKL